MTSDEARAEFLRQKALGLDPLMWRPPGSPFNPYAARTADDYAVVHRPDHLGSGDWDEWRRSQ